MNLKYDFFEPIKGDDKAYWTIHYRDVPEPFRLNDAWEVLTDELPLLTGVKEKIIEIFDLHYGRFEINAETYQDFLEMLQETLLLNADKYEGYLELLNSEMTEIGFGRSETRSKTTETTREKTGTSSTTTDEDMSTSSSSELDEQRDTSSVKTSVNNVIDIPADNAIDDKPTSRVKEDGTDTIDDDLTSSQSTTGTQERDVLSSGTTAEDESGTITETDEYSASDKDAIRNLEYLGMYLDKSRSFSEVFLTSFKNCFMNAVAWYVI